ncbi:alpha-crystallin HspX [Sinomonas notoginsengisoli]|uniref:Hsp20/alpha crystallin family protein n=1 Tax=Sinomonas notoginsengisoli TaxID=1457311 RepID=UPI001F1F1BE0|nr:Hsp20/alpha crystallin family protein [Sinomonas notoginsengisoli]
MAEGWGRRGPWDMMPEGMRRFGLPEQFKRFVDEWETSWLRVEQFREGDSLVVRAELAGIDPEKDVDVTVQDGTLTIKAERRESSENRGKGGYRSEFRYGSFARTLDLPRGARGEDVKASYHDGVLEVRVPVAPESGPGPTKVNVSRD